MKMRLETKVTKDLALRRGSRGGYALMTTWARFTLCSRVWRSATTPNTKSVGISGFRPHTPPQRSAAVFGRSAFRASTGFARLGRDHRPVVTRKPYAHPACPHAAARRPFARCAPSASRTYIAQTSADAPPPPDIPEKGDRLGVANYPANQRGVRLPPLVVDCRTHAHGE